MPVVFSNRHRLWLDGFLEASLVKVDAWNSGRVADGPDGRSSLRLLEHSQSFGEIPFQFSNGERYLARRPGRRCNRDRIPLGYVETPQLCPACRANWNW
jgi:hypothetical protein